MSKTIFRVTFQVHGYRPSNALIAASSADKAWSKLSEKLKNDNANFLISKIEGIHEVPDGVVITDEYMRQFDEKI